MKINIYSHDGSLKLAASPGSGGQCVKQLQGDSELALSFDYFEYVALDVNDYVDFCGDRYWLLEQYRPKEVSTVQWKYDIKLYGIESLIKRYLVVEHTDGDANPVFTLTAPASRHVRMIVECLNNATGTEAWSVGTVVETGNITIDYTGKYCDEGLRELAGAADTEYWFDGRAVNLCRCEHGNALELEYGNGLVSLERDVADNAKFYSRLYPVGSSRNINPETYGHARLQLPDGRKYVDLDVERYGVIDHYEQDAFSGIYPRYTGTVSSVRFEERTSDDGTVFRVYFLKDNSLPFDPNDYLLPNEKIRVSFQTGDLQGLGETDDHYFEADFDSTTGEFEIINIWTDGEQLPREGLVPAVGDQYIPWNISMPDSYIRLAEQEFKTAVDDYNQRHFVDVSVYRGTADHVWIEAVSGEDVSVGRRVKLVSSQYFPDDGYRISRIVKITRRLDLPSQMELEISDAVSTGTLTKLNDTLKNMADEISTGTNVFYEFIGNRFGTFISAIKNQIDLKAETWISSSDPSLPWLTNTNDMRDAHVGDMWLNSSSVTVAGVPPMATAIYTKDTTTSPVTYSWVVDESIPNEVFDTIDGKAAIYANNPADTDVAKRYPSNYHTNDLWILPKGIQNHDTFTINGVNYKGGEVLTAICTSAEYDARHWTKKVVYTDDTYAHGFDYLKTAMKGDTSIQGGLLLSNMLVLRNLNGSTPSDVMSGINGVLDTSLEKPLKSIAAWYGGNNVDIEALSGTAKETYDNLTADQKAASKNYAKTLFRFDGSGYVANGNISWDASGTPTIKGNTIDTVTLKINGTEVNFDNYVTTNTAQGISALKTFNAGLVATKLYLYKPNSDDTNAVYFVKDTNGVRLVGAGFYSDSFVSTLGASTGGGGSSVTLREPLNGINNAGIGAPQTNGSALIYSSGWKYSTASGVSLSVAGNVITTNGYIQSANGFKVPAKDNTCVLLAGGSTMKLSDIVVSSVSRLSQTTGVTSLSTFYTDNDLTYTAAGGGNDVQDLPNSRTAFGAISFKTAAGYHGQILLEAGADLYVRSAQTLSGGWRKVAMTSDFSGLFTTLANSGNNISITVGGTNKTLEVGYSSRAGYTQILRSQVMASGDDYDALLDGYTASRGSFVAVNINSLTSGVTLTDLGAYDTLVSFGYSTRTIQFKGAAYSSSLKYRYAVNPSSGVYNFSDWKTIAFTDSNVASATKLQTSRTLWGNNFDGTQNISGSIYVDNNRSIYFKDTSNSYNVVIGVDSNNYLHIGYGTSGNGYPTYIHGNAIGLLYGTSRTMGLYLDSGGAIGIGTSSPSTKLHVAGNIYATGRIYLYRNSSDSTKDIYLVFDGNSTTPGIHLVGAGFYSDSYVSALGQSTGSGGGVTLHHPLSEINSANLAAASVNGSALIYSSGWKYSTASGVSLSVAGNVITTNGYIQSANGFKVPAKDNTCVLLAGGSTMKLSDIVVSSVSRLSQTTGVTSLSTFYTDNDLTYTAAGGGNDVQDLPNSRTAFGAISFKTAAGYHGQILLEAGADLYVRSAQTLSGGWRKVAMTSDFSGLFTTLANSGNNISITVGGTNKTLEVGYSSRAGYTQILRSQVMASGDDYDALLDGYTASRGSFVAVNINSLTSGVTLTDLGAYDTLVSFGYSTRTIQFKGAAYSSSLKYRYAVNPSSGVYNFSDWKTIAFTDSNVASATKLQTARTLWGQSFDGSANVSGDMTGVGNISPSVSGSGSIGSRNNYFSSFYGKELGIVDSTTNEDMAFIWRTVGETRVFAMYAYETKYNPIIVGQSGAQSGGGIYIDAANNRVGIGTYSPSYKLHVNGGALFQHDNYTGTLVLRRNKSGAYGVSMTFANNDGNLGDFGCDGGGFFNLRNSSGTSLISAVLSSGNVGIGTTSPSYKLDVSGSVRATGSVSADTISITSTSGVSHLSFARGGYNYIQCATSGGELGFITNGASIALNNCSMLIGSNGNVGIGTTSPAYKLDVTGSSQIGGKLYVSSGSTGESIQVNSTNTYSCINYRISGTHKWSVGASSSNQFYFYSSSSVATISSDGLGTFSGGLSVPSGKTVKIGNLYLSYDQGNNAIRVSANADGTGAANFYSTGAVSALGANTGSGSGITLREPLSSINSANLSANPEAGSALVYTANGWKYSTTSGATLKIGSITCTSATYLNASLTVGATTKLSSYVGIGTNPDISYMLKVSGDTYINGFVFDHDSVEYNNVTISNVNRIYANNNLYVAPGAGHALFSKGGWNIVSDMRQKDIINFIDSVSAEHIAMAPVFNFRWKTERNGNIHLGSSAQYWQNVLPYGIANIENAVLTMDYGATALAAAVITARKVVDHEHRIQELERENERLKEVINDLMAA